MPSNATPPVLSRLRDDDWDSDGSFDDGAKAYTPTWGDLAGIPYHTAPEGEEEAGESDGSGMDPESYKEAVLMLHSEWQRSGRERAGPACTPTLTLMFLLSLCRAPRGGGLGPGGARHAVWHATRERNGRYHD
jgi:hypothetical protein